MFTIKFIVLLIFLNQRVRCTEEAGGNADETTQAPMLPPLVEAAVQPTGPPLSLTNSTSPPSKVINSTESVNNITTPATAANITVASSKEEVPQLNVTSSSALSAVIAPLNVTESIVPIETCPAECKCAPSLVDAICTGRSLQDIPHGLSSRVKMLILTSNSITEIDENCFKERNLFELMSLLMNHNRITSLHPNAFVVLKHLEVLDLGDNSLQVLSPDLFVNNMALATLRLDNNTKLQMPSSGALINAPTLHDLNISSCNISFLPNDIFSGTPVLDTIDLSGNNLKELNPLVLKSLPDLVRIILPKSFEPKSDEICSAHEKLEKIVISNKGYEENIECGKLLLSNTSTPLITVVQENLQVNDTIVDAGINSTTELGKITHVVANSSSGIAISENIVKVAANLTSGITEPEKIGILGSGDSLSDSGSSQNDSNIQNDVVPVVNKNTESISNMEVRMSSKENQLNRLVSQTSENKMESTAKSEGLSGTQIDNIIIGILLTIIAVTGAAIIINLNKQRIDAYFNRGQRRQESTTKANEFEIEPLKNVVSNE